LEQRKQVISAFERQDAVRERLQVILSGLQGRGGSELWELLWNPPALTPPHPLFLYDIVFVLALLAAPLIISSSWYTIYILLISYINSRLHARAYQDIRRYVHSVRAVGQLVVASAKLARVEAGFLERFSA
ncbi:MAG TPA: hypothetical protein DDX25_05805, partial [Firmicutes bacterium]|nr:hypothetical protein [Bacillota bacterium]